MICTTPESTTAPAGTPVAAMQGGRVTAIARSGDVTITHPDGSTKTYRHIDPAGIRVGQEVAGGAAIGSLRAHDPRSTGPHLHLEATDAAGRKYDPRGEIDGANRPERALAGKPEREEARASRFMDPSDYRLKRGAGAAEAGDGAAGLQARVGGPSVVQHFHTCADAHEVGRRAQLEQKCVDSQHFDKENGHTTLGDVFQTLFKGSGKEVVVHPDIAGKEVSGGYMLRWNQSTIDFASSLAMGRGASIKVMGDKVLVLKNGSGESASGQPLPTIMLKFQENYEFDVELEPRFQFSKMSASYLDTDEGKLQSEDKTSGRGQPRRAPASLPLEGRGGRGGGGAGMAGQHGPGHVHDPRPARGRRRRGGQGRGVRLPDRRDHLDCHLGDPRRDPGRRLGHDGGGGLQTLLIRLNRPSSGRRGSRSDRIRSCAECHPILRATTSYAEIDVRNAPERVNLWCASRQDWRRGGDSKYPHLFPNEINILSWS